jgi:hypothetical protein
MALLHTMFNPIVNAACNNNLFTGGTIFAMTKTHPSIERLYGIAADHGDHSPASVARRLNVSAQRLGNWETRGISKAGALDAQDCYGADANWLRTGSGARTAPQQQSQSLRLDPVKLSEVHRALRELSKDAGKSFDIERDADSARLLQAYEIRVQMPAKPSHEEWTRYGMRLARIMATQGAAPDGRRDSVPTEGTDTGRVARRIRGKT